MALGRRRSSFTFALHAGVASPWCSPRSSSGCGALGWNALVYVSAGERVDPSLAARSVAVAATVVFVLSGIATPLLGALVDAAGWDALWLATARIAALGALLAAPAAAATRRRTRPEGFKAVFAYCMVAVRGRDLRGPGVSRPDRQRRGRRPDPRRRSSTGRVAPAQRLKEEELAQQLGISRTPIREALLVLQTEGLLEATPNRGATVRSYDVADARGDVRAAGAAREPRRAAGGHARHRRRSSTCSATSCDRFAALVGGDDVPAARRRRTASSTTRSSRPPTSERLTRHGAPGRRAAARLQVVRLVLAGAGVGPRTTTTCQLVEGARGAATASGRSSSCASTSSRPATCSCSTSAAGLPVAERGPRSGGRVTADGAPDGPARSPVSGSSSSGTLLAGPFTGRLLGDLGRRDHQGRGAGPARPDPRLGQGALRGPLALVAGAVAEQEVHHAQPRETRGQELLARARRARRRRHRELPAGDAREVESRLRPAQRGEPARDPRARLRLRADRARTRERAGFASVAEAMGGIRYINGFPGEPPPRMHLSLGDSLAGMFAAQGILAAIYWRDVARRRARAGRRRLADGGVLRAAREHRARVRPARDRPRPAGDEPQGHRAVATSSSRATTSGW